MTLILTPVPWSKHNLVRIPNQSSGRMSSILPDILRWKPGYQYFEPDPISWVWNLERHLPNNGWPRISAWFFPAWYHLDPFGTRWTDPNCSIYVSPQKPPAHWCLLWIGAQRLQLSFWPFDKNTMRAWFTPKNRYLAVHRAQSIDKNTWLHSGLSRAPPLKSGVVTYSVIRMNHLISLPKIKMDPHHEHVQRKAWLLTCSNPVSQRNIGEPSHVVSDSIWKFESKNTTPFQVYSHSKQAHWRDTIPCSHPSLKDSVPGKARKRIGRHLRCKCRSLSKACSLLTLQDTRAFFDWMSSEWPRFPSKARWKSRVPWVLYCNL